METDSEETRGYRAGDRSARFLELLGPHRVALERYATRALVVADEAEDVLQGALLNAFRDFARFTEGTHFRAFVFRYLVHEVQNANRRVHPERLDPSPEPTDGTLDVVALLERESAYQAVLARPEVVFPHVEDEVLRAVASLPEAERSAFLLRAIAGLKYVEIAATLGIPLGTALTRLHNARARLRRALTDYAVARRLIRAEDVGENGSAPP